MDDILPKIHSAAPATVAALFLALLALEGAFPLRKRASRRLPRYIVNAAMTAFTFLAGALAARAVGLNLAEWAQLKSFGLLHAAPLPSSIRFILGFLLMDLSFYYWHRANHELPLLWRFHNAHHIDPDLDVTTSFRFHFAEVLYSSGFRAVQVLSIGVSPITYVFYELVFSCGTAFHHSNLRLPLSFERALGKIFVTPRMHGVHHSAIKEETNSNYSVIFRWWDVLHRTLRLGVRQSDITIGVPAYLAPGDNSFASVLAMPFARQRDYWTGADGIRPSRTPLDPRLMME